MLASENKKFDAEPEKHLLSQDAVDMLLDGAVAEKAVEHGWCSKVFFGLRSNDAGPSANLQIHPEDKVASQNNNSREARNIYSEGAANFGGTSPLTATNVATPGGLPAFPYFAAAKYTARPAH